MLKKIPINIYIEPETFQKLQSIKKETMIPTTTFIRNILDNGIANYEQQREFTKTAIAIHLAKQENTHV